MEREADEDQQADELDRASQPPHAAVCNGGRWSCKAHVRTDGNNRIMPFPVSSGFGPADFASAYKLSSYTTSTATIAIVDAFHYPNAESDLAMYRDHFGLPPCTVKNGCLQIVNQYGAKHPMPSTPPPGDNWNIEAALDLDMASAACPTCKLVLLEADDDQGNGVFVAQNTAAALPGVVSISDSWGGPSDGTDVTMDAEFFTHSQAVNTFVASGDSGNTGATPDYPSTSAHVIAVGGTRLVKSSTARGWTETAWSGAGSSCSQVIAKPSFQSVVHASACGMRATADVAAVADPVSPVSVFNADIGGWIVVGGTSVASPLVAAIYARYSIPGSSHDASFAYTHTSQFFDITSGDNGTCTSALCKAGRGWDGPTGIGSPNGALLAP
ncbi:MAG TPA: S53 family peptidase [Kofleriaceae bacterium]|nr:S53 family peptidase [Kofleriaceae bacterium]